jgi:hypothetical protein
VAQAAPSPSHLFRELYPSRAGILQHLRTAGPGPARFKAGLMDRQDVPSQKHYEPTPLATP